MFSKIVYFTSVIIIKLGFFLCHVFGILFHIRFFGNKIAKDRPIIIIATHESWLDIVALAPMFSMFRWMYYISKKELWGIHPFIAWWLGMVRAIKIDRGTGDRKALQTALDVLKTKNILVIFPEGSRIKPFDKKWDIEEGAAAIAMMAKKNYLKNDIPENLRPILYPIAICYRDQKRLILGSIKHINVIVGDPIEIDTAISRKEFTQMLADKLKHLYNKSLEKMYLPVSSTKHR